MTNSMLPVSSLSPVVAKIRCVPRRIRGECPEGERGMPLVGLGCVSQRPRSGRRWRALRESNPCFRRERAVIPI
jgi:hypothetical protein